MNPETHNVTWRKAAIHHVIVVIAVAAPTWTRALGCLKVKLHTADAPNDETYPSQPPRFRNHLYNFYTKLTEEATQNLPKMDALVAQYSRPAHAQAAAAEQQEDLDFTQDMPALSLKFAVPPVAQVCNASTLFSSITLER